MKKRLLSLGVALFLCGFSSFSQQITQKANSNKTIENVSEASPKVNFKNVPTHSLPAPNLVQLITEDAVREANGMMHRIGIHLFTNITPLNAGVWSTLPNGDRMWQLGVKSKGAEALSFIFNNFVLSKGSTLIVNDRKTGKAVSNILTQGDMQENLMQNIALCFGDDLVLTLIDKAGTIPSTFNIERVTYNYRDTGNPNPPTNPQKINESGSCNVNVNCPEGTNYQDEKRGVARIYVVESGSAGWCTGSLVNNLANNCKPLFLTALHCGPTTSASDMTLWKFYFNYEAPSCTNPTSTGTLANYFITGCVRLADSGDGGNITLSDFLLVQLGTLANEATTITTLKSGTFNAYWNGWDANTTASTSGVGIHHPAGDIKKISTYTSALTSTSYTGQTANTHWRADWVSTTTNWGITEGGSSGSSLFTYNNGNSRIVGTLSGGASSCTATAGNKNDMYGKMSYHWTSCGTASNRSLKYHLDPNNTGVLIQDGSYNPCAPVNTPPVANFSASSTAPCVGSGVTLTDQSTNTPTSWSWSITPNTFSYTGGTSSTSQNPQVIFNATGPYTVALTATNAYGNNTSTQTNYISPTSGSALPLTENFEGATFPPTGWSILNADNGSVAWGTDGAKGFERRPAAGNTGSASGCAAINCFNYNTANTVDGLIVKSISLTGANSPKMTFKRAYKYYNNPTYYDELRVYVSTDCGTTYGTAVYTKTGTQLATNGTLNTAFTPSVAGDWDTDTVDLTAYVGQTVVIKFEVTNKWGNDIYIDDINIASVALTASVTITSNDADNTICAGSSVTFTATPTNGGTAPTYQWKLNGTNINGATSSTYTTTSLTNGGSITCVMTSNLGGVLSSPATSNSIVTTVNAIPTTPSITSNSPVCVGSAISLSTPAVTSATYAWTGPNSYSSSSQNPSISSATTAMSGMYNVTVTVNGCTSSAGTSTVTVNTIPSTPTITSNSPVCSGSAITLNTPTVSNATYAWTGPNSFTSASQNPSISSATTGMAGTYNVTVTVNGCTSTAGTSSISVNSSVTPSVAIAITNGGNPTCVSQSVTYTATPTNGGASPSYQWKLNGTNIPGATSATYTPSSIANNDVFTCVLTSNAACASPSTATSSGITMTVTSTVTPSVSIAASNTTICSGSSVTFTASPTNGGTAPTYQWKVNGSNVATGSTFTSTTLANNDVVTCVMTSNSSCASPSTGTSNSITMSVTSSVTPSVSAAITSGSNPTCSGSSVTFSATPTNGGASPSYQWTVNGVNAGTGSTFTSSSLTNGASVVCVMTSNATCVSSSTGSSSPIAMQITSNVTPSIAISASSTTICNGSSVTFTATPTNGGNAPSYQWKVNGTNVSTGATYTTTSLANNDVVTCVLTSNATCVSNATATSNAVTITVSAPVTPSVSIALTSGTNPMCAGESVTFSASQTNGGIAPTYQWQLNGSNVGSNSSSYTNQSLVNGDVVTCVMTSNAGCVTTSTATSSPITMSVNAIPATPVITNNNGVLTSSSATGNQWYFNNVAIVGAIGQTYTATQNGDYYVVVTVNGCSSTSAVTTVSGLGLDELTNHINISIYPNPNGGQFTIDVKSSEINPVSIKITDMTGRLIYLKSDISFVEELTEKINIEEKGKGTYFIHVTSGEYSKIEKVIVH